MLDIDLLITDWRRQMAAGGFKSPAVLDELESHLRDEIEKQLQSGRTVRQAFESAVQRLGKREELQREFAGANPASRLRGWNWLVAACFAFPLLCLARRALVLAKLFGFWFFGWTAMERALGCAAIALLVLAICSWPFAPRFVPLIVDRRNRVAALLACSVAGPLWFKLAPQIFLPAQPADGRFIVTLLWLMIPCALLMGAVYGLELAARRAANEPETDAKVSL